jgi:hypothetical protein
MELKKIKLQKNRSTFLRKNESKQIAMESLLGSSAMYTLSFLFKYSKDLADVIS